MKENIAPMDMTIAVGYGTAQVMRDGEIIYNENTANIQSYDDYKTLSEFEEMAEQDPDHDWRVILNAPFKDSEYQRRGKEKWVLIKSGMGFA
uniref:Uncharacterized protein n=1 Tax=viral metagenome TaxID=1070528 RepID=A0A6M3JIZ2_9ZZZZ